MYIKKRQIKIHRIIISLGFLTLLAVFTIFYPQEDYYEVVPRDRSADQYIQKGEGYYSVLSQRLHHKTINGSYHDTNLSVYRVKNKDIRFYSVEIDEITIFYQISNTDDRYYYSGFSKSGLYYSPSISQKINQEYIQHPMNLLAQNYIKMKKI